MQIHGLNKTTLLDYPGIVASVIFTGACNFRCPFCQNSDIVIVPSSQPLISEDEVFSHLNKRKGIVKGICITGGEPTLQPDLAPFIRKVKELGMLVKLDTNGYRPEVISGLLEEGLLDYVAMDIKSSFSSYSEASGIDVDTDRIKESIALIMGSGIEYEFRTTVVKELHSKQTFEEIGEMLNGAKKYYLQGYIDSDRVIKKGLSAYSRKEMEEFAEILAKNINKVDIRGIE